MQALLYVELNCFCLAILLLIFMNVRLQNRYLLDQKLFLTLLFTDAVILILDMVMWLADGIPDPSVRIINLLISALYYSLNPLICAFWYFYVDYYINRSLRRLKRIAVPMLIPAAVNMILSFASIFNGMLFTIGEDGVYDRGSFFFVMAGISYFYLMYALIYAIIGHGKTQAKEYVILTVFPILPIIGGLLQTLFYGTSVLWASVTIALLLIFINFQNTQLSTDHLTSLYNRRQLDSYLRAKLPGVGGKPVAGIMIDLNSFKYINDTYGHYSGDRALKYTAEILKKTFRRSDFVARYGGDEFVVIVETEDPSALEKIIGRLNESTAQFNEKGLLPYAIDLSIGYDFIASDKTTPDEFLKHIDALMYIDKHKSKENPLS